MRETIAHSTNCIEALLEVNRIAYGGRLSRLKSVHWRWELGEAINASVRATKSTYFVKLTEGVVLRTRQQLDAAIQQTDSFPGPLGEQRNVALALATRGALFVMAHELAHVVRGHLEFSATFGISVIDESFRADLRSERFPRRYLEYDADAYAIGMMLDLYESNESFDTDTASDVAEEIFWIHLATGIQMLLMDASYPDGFAIRQDYPCFKRRMLAISRSLIATGEARYGLQTDLTEAYVARSWNHIAAIAGGLQLSGDRFWTGGATQAEVENLVQDIDQYVAFEPSLADYAQIHSHYDA